MSHAPVLSLPLVRACALAFALLLVACGGGGGGSAPNAGGASTPPAATLTSISVSPSGPTLNVGATLDLQATGTFSNGTSTTPYDAQVTWTSNNPAKATVNAGGVVTGVAVGTCTITAAKDGLMANVTVTVTTSAVTLTGIALNPTSASLAVGQIVDFTASAIWSNGTGSSPYDSNVVWTSSNPAVATVSNLGLVTAVSGGTTTIMASASGHTASATVSVTAAAATLTSITLTPATAALSVGGTVDIAATGNFSNGTSVQPYDTQVVWTTSAAGVATVDVYGIVTAVGAGSATITATKGAIHASATVTVTAPSFDPALVGRWQWIGVPDANGNNYGSFYTFNANGTFTYSLIYQGGGFCISYSQVVAHHQGTFSSGPGVITLHCSTHGTDYTQCSGAVQSVPLTPGSHDHQATFSGGLLYTNHADDFQATGWIGHAKQ